MKLGAQVSLGPGHIVLDGDLAPPPPKVHSPPVFGPYLLWPNGWTDQDATYNNNNKPICNAPDASVTDPEARRTLRNITVRVDH